MSEHNCPSDIELEKKIDGEFIEKTCEDCQDDFNTKNPNAKYCAYCEPEFNLSEKMFTIENVPGFHPEQKIITEENVKEFIRRLRNAIHDLELQDNIRLYELYEDLDKLAGDKFHG